MKKKSKQKNIKTIKMLSNEFIADAEFDFHDRGKLLPYDIEKYLEDFIEESLIEENFKVLIITGKGLVVRPLVEKLLRHNKNVKHFKQAGYFNGQSGAFEVVLQKK